MSGTTWDQLAFVPTQRGPVVPGSGVTAPGDRVKLGDGSGAGTAMLCIAGGEIVAGFGGGQTTSLTGNRYKSTADKGAADGKGKRSSNEGVSVSQRVTELVLDDLNATEEQIGELLKKEKLEFRDNTLKLNYAAAHKFIDIAKAKKMLKV